MNDLESLRQIFSDKREHIVIGQIKKLAMASDRSCLKCLVSIFTNDEKGSREIVARMTWNSVGPDSGDFEFPSVGDLALVVFAGSDVDQAFIIRMLSSKEDRIPARADAGKVVRARAGNKLWLTSDTKVLISSNDTEPTENLVLGQQLVSLLSDILTELSTLSQAVATHTHAGNLGYPTSVPNNAGDFTNSASAFDDLKSSPVEDEAILSQMAYTE